MLYMDKEISETSIERYIYIYACACVHVCVCMCVCVVVKLMYRAIPITLGANRVPGGVCVCVCVCRCKTNV